MYYKHRNNCRGCGSRNLTEILNLGKMPLAGAFISSKDEINCEIKIPLKVYFCEECKLVQILDIVNPEILFQNYKYTSSVIPSLENHFHEYSIFLKNKYLKSKNSSILEFGCNDGVLLKNFKNDKNIISLGIDPSKNITQLAKKKGLNIITDYFNQNRSQKILKSHGKIDVITGSNVFAHVDDVHEIIKAAKLLLKPEGVFIIEVHYLKDLIDKFQYDTVYHEHLCYYSITSLDNIFKSENMKIVDVKHLKMHGGAVRVTVVLSNSKRKISKNVNSFLKREKEINNSIFLQKFKRNCIDNKKQLTKLLLKLKKQKNTIVGYGAPGRSTILLNFCHINQNILDYVVDISPLRSGKLTPGTHIPIYYPDKCRIDKPNYILVLAWNYLDSILEQEKILRNNKTKFIVPLPKIKII